MPLSPIKITRITWLIVNGLFLAFLIGLCSLPSQLHARQKTRPATKPTAMEPILKVKLGSTHKKLSVKFPDGGHILNSKGRRIKTFRKNGVFSWSLPASGKKGRSRIEHNGETLSCRPGGSLLEFNGKRYRGHIEMRISAKGATVVNHVGLESYLRGVVGSEIGSRSPAESIKAQTVIARTYAYANRGKHGSDGADVCDSTHCQVYSGVSAERDSIDPAVVGTRGIVMISEGRPIETLYHATCGGMTSDNDKVFGGAPRSYLRRVVCPFCREGINYRWTRSIGVNELRTALRQEKIVFEQLRTAEIDSPSHMDRVTSLILNTNKGTFKIKGTTIRRLFNLPSTTFVLAERRLPAGGIAALSEKPSEPYELPGRFVKAQIQSIESAGPPQMFILTSHGLKRTTRPEKGWQVFVAAAQSAAAIKPAASRIMVRSPAAAVLTKLDLFGRGYGHQVGLCQAGAIELGKRDWSYRQILALYYSNVALRSLDY